MLKRYSLLPPAKIPIAWLLLSRFKVKFLSALLGIIFASVLIHAQLGLRSALFESSISIFKTFNADIVMINRLSVGSTTLQGFDPNRLAIFERYAEVTATTPVRYDFVRWHYPDSRKNSWVIMLGFNPKLRVFNKEDIIANQDSLKLPSRILYDELSRKEFGPVRQDYEKSTSVVAFVNDKRVKISGLIKIGTSFSYDSSFLTSLSTFETLSGLTTPGNIEIGLIKTATGVNAEKFLASVQEDLASDVKIYTLDGFLQLEKDYWDRSKPIGFVFGFNAMLGFFVGMLILYQILFTDVTSHLSDFSTMLALAFSYRRIRLIVFQESLILTVVGYPIGVVVSILLFAMIQSVTGVPVRMSMDQLLICFALTILMSTCSAFMAMRKLDDANPIEVYE